jgi:hypothetical protein
MTAQAEVFKALHTNQAKMMQALSSVNMELPKSLPDFSMAYAIPTALGELPQPPPRSLFATGDAALDPATKYTNLPPLLGGAYIALN